MAEGVECVPSQLCMVVQLKCGCPHSSMTLGVLEGCDAYCGRVLARGSSGPAMVVWRARGLSALLAAVAVEWSCAMDASDDVWWRLLDTASEPPPSFMSRMLFGGIAALLDEARTKFGNSFTMVLTGRMRGALTPGWKDGEEGLVEWSAGVGDTANELESNERGEVDVCPAPPL